LFLQVRADVRWQSSAHGVLLTEAAAGVGVGWGLRASSVEQLTISSSVIIDYRLFMSGNVPVPVEMVMDGIRTLG
jgi:hypothetical protein